MRKACVGICVMAAFALNHSMADSAWYIAAGAGVGEGDDVQQEGWNRDSICYPDSACFDADPVPSLPGYRWTYDNALDPGSAFELSLGRELGRARLELAISQQSNDIQQAFASIAYFDRASIEPRAGAPVDSGASGSIAHQRVRSLVLDIFYDFPRAWGAISPWVGAGVGMSSVEMGSVRFSTSYSDVSGRSEVYDPPLAFYGSRQNEDLSDQVFVWRLHAGADYALSAKTSIGLKFTWVAAGDIEDTGSYLTHPMHETDVEFENVNTFSGARNWRLMLVLRRSIGL